MGLGVERFGGPVGVEGVDKRGREELEILTLGLRLLAGPLLVEAEVVRGCGTLTPFCAGPTAPTPRFSE